MGGDNAPASVIDGADIAKAQAPQIEFIFVGDERLYARCWRKHSVYKMLKFCTQMLRWRPKIPHHRRCAGGGIVLCGWPLHRWPIKKLMLLCCRKYWRLDGNVKIAIADDAGITRPAIAGFFPTEQKRVCLTLVQILNAMKITLFNLR